MKEVGISVETLYNEYGNILTYGTIRTEEDNYYDLITNDGDLACMDGEICHVMYNNEDDVILINEEGEENFTFRLTKEEFGIAVFTTETTN